MGSALLSGWLRDGIDSAAVRVIDPAPPEATVALMKSAGIAADPTLPTKLRAGVLVLAVKPQTISGLLPSLRSLVGKRTTVLSIAAGTTLATLCEGLGTDSVVRAMPNMPAQIGRGISVIVAGPGVGQPARDLAMALLGSAGAVEWIEEEGLMDAVTAVSGSGPAYVFLLAECLAEAGVEAGLSPELSRKLADSTIAGAGALLAESGEKPDVLRKAVTSPGGTTEAALAVLMADGGLGSLMRKAVAEAKRRAVELR